MVVGAINLGVSIRWPLLYTAKHNNRKETRFV